MNSFAVLADQRTAPGRSWWQRVFAAGAAASVVALLTAGASAEFMDGNMLHRYCSAPVPSLTMALCLGYISGVSDAVDEGGDLYGCSELCRSCRDRRPDC